MVHDPLDGLHSLVARQPDNPRRRVLLRQGGEVAHRRRRGEAAAHDDGRLVGVVRPAFAENVFQTVSDVSLRGDLADRRNAAVAEGAMAAISPGAVEYDVGFLDPLLAVRRAQQEAEGLLAAAFVAGGFLLEEAGTSHLRDERLRANVVAER